MTSKSDPNGIRTRVTAVKGRCPGPLDDRVESAQLSVGRLVLQVCVWVLKRWILTNYLVDQRDCASRSAQMRLDYAQRSADHFHPNARVIQQAACLFDQF